MKNMDVVAMLEEFADLKEIAGETIFRIRAYRTAAEAIGRMGEAIETITAAGKLTEIDGVGMSLAKKITEFLDTGRVRDLEKLHESVPPSLRTLLNVPEMGPKSVKLVHDDLGIIDLDGLETAAKSGSLRNLPRMGIKTEENIIRGIEVLRSAAGRTRIDIAMSVSNAIIAMLKPMQEVKKILAAGSLRRMKETIGDIDILVATTNGTPIMDRFVKLEEVTDVLAHGPTKSSIRFEKEGKTIQVDMRTVEPDSFGAAAQYFTGSQEHNVALRQHALQLGLTLNEYGMFKVENGQKVAGSDEESVYKTLKMDWIPPEIRENWGELEWALNGKLPELVAEKDILGDLHMHTNWSDGQQPIEQMVAACKKWGHQFCAITDHSPPLAWGVKPPEFKKELKEIRAVAQQAEIEVLAGIEVDIQPDGSLGMPDSILKELDIVIASVHSSMKMDQEQMTKRILTALHNPYVTVLGHPTGRLIGQREPYEVDLPQIISIAKEKNIFLEINAAPQRLDLCGEHAHLCREAGVKVTINTDAHHEAHLNFMQYGVSMARRGGLEASDVINTFAPKQLRQLIRRS